MRYFLGFDGGGTKTECVLLDSRGEVVGAGSAGASNPLRVGFPKAQAALHAAASAALRSARLKRIRVEAVCAGLAGAGRPTIARRVGALLKRSYPQAAVKVVTDLEVALEAAVGPGPGVVLVAGTGSAAYGRNAAGETARAGGWGPWIGDEGSAFDIGRLAVATAALARDRREPLDLEAKILSGIRCPDWETLVERIAGEPDAVFPKIFLLVTEAAGGGDSIARGILSSAAKSLADLAGDVIRSLALARKEFLLAKVGGVFGQSAYLDSTLQEWLAGVAPRIRVEPLPVSPAVGAARLALRLAQGAVDGREG
jgi:N-acetylglucosamine kinase-like BadF-type ATPase